MGLLVGSSSNRYWKAAAGAAEFGLKVEAIRRSVPHGRADVFGGCHAHAPVD